MHAVLMRVRTAPCAASCDSSDMYRVQCTCYLCTSAYYCYYCTCGAQDVVGRRPFLSICQKAFYWLYVCICVLSLLNYLSVCVLIIPVISYFRKFRPAITQSLLTCFPVYSENLSENNQNSDFLGLFPLLQYSQFKIFFTYCIS